MHELSVTKSILNICENEEAVGDFKKINKINLCVGEITGLVPDCINYYFNIISKGTIAEDAVINIKKISLKINCLECKYEGVMDKREYLCPNCNGRNFKILNGKEFYLESIEVD
ncbi:hydrogenase maturation nickel metallochaperone HypA [Clostridium sardiniense]|uniref:hydrogenase maturation nickel metallochaperone HypA n=1 Tax=Clostridium sardiniense TaxID=29369 RepID=UPI003D33A916